MMKRFLWILVMGLLLSGCATLNYKESQSAYGGTITNHGSYMGLSHDAVQRRATSQCQTYNPNSVARLSLRYEGGIMKFGEGGEYDLWNYQCVTQSGNSTSSSYSSSSSTSSSSSSTSSSYSSDPNSSTKPRLHFDPRSGGMRECTYDPGPTNCLSFKLFNKSLYTKNTLFYNSKTGAMQPCLGIVTYLGQCTAYGLYTGTASKHQLFYDPKNKKMTTCSHVTATGTCAMYDLVPKKLSKNTGVFSEPGSSVTFSEPGSSVTFSEPGSSIIFSEPGSNIFK